MLLTLRTLPALPAPLVDELLIVCSLCSAPLDVPVSTLNLLSCNTIP